jgi:transglutaminase-like putative cysteine protease
VPLDIRFRLSMYLTLAAACLALALAQQPLLPETFFFAGPVLALLVPAFLLEGRWSLPAWAANLLGLVIAAGWGVWIDQRFFDAAEPWHDPVLLLASLLPEIGALLLLLVLARLFRPKERRDVWVLHGLGLLQVALGCVLGFTPAFGAALFLYVVCALWSLALFHLRGGTEGAGRPVPGRRPAAAPTVRPVRWAVGVTAAALGACLLLPRGGETWDPLRLVPPGSRSPAVPTGGGDQVDLNRTGWVEINDELAFVVSAEDANHQPKLDISPAQRWRGFVLDQYRNGRWGSGWGLSSEAADPREARAIMRSMPLQLVPEEDDGGPQRTLFDLGPDQYFVTFDVEGAKAGGVYLSDPVVVRGPRARATEAGFVSFRAGRTGTPLFVEFEGTLVPGQHSYRGKVRYRQVTVPPEEPDLGPPAVIHVEYANYLCRQPVAGLTEWTRRLVRDLAAGARFGLTPADLEWEPAPAGRLRDDHPDGILPAARREKVARALTAYLARSPEYTYSLELRRQDWGADPTFDFLCNVKEGHCERYAGGLALMLRSLGIPARLVRGFRGADPRGDGTYDVHSSQAHAWVEILVPRPGTAGATHWHWLALDATPTGEPRAPPWFAPGRWWDRGREAAETFWRFFVVDYNGEQQDRLLSDLGGALANPSRWRLPDVRWLLGLGLLPVCLAGLWLARRLRFRRDGAPSASPVTFFRRLLAILARRRGLLPAPAQTPREFGAVARQALAALPADLAALPGEVAELLYRVRYGAVPLTEAERQDVDRRLAQLDAALARR